MIQNYVMKLIENLPLELQNVKSPIHMDIVLDGGAFNGSYLIGALFFLKEMERRKFIKVHRISGSSVGSVAALLYLLDRLDVMEYFHDTATYEFQNNHSLHKMLDFEALIKNKIDLDPEMYNTLQNKLYITYNNIKKRKTIVKSSYKDNKDVLDTIVKSCFVPFLVSNSLLLNNTYLDGINPYVFPFKKDKRNVERKILYLDLFGYDKFKYLVNVKNEKSGFHRTLSGLLEIHNFFIKQSSTEMCSYVNDWSVFNRMRYFVKKATEKIILYSVYLLVFLKPYFQFETTIPYKILSVVVHDIYILLLQTYCL